MVVCILGRYIVEGLSLNLDVELLNFSSSRSDVRWKIESNNTMLLSNGVDEREKDGDYYEQWKKERISSRNKERGNKKHAKPRL